LKRLFLKIRFSGVDRIGRSGFQAFEGYATISDPFDKKSAVYPRATGESIHRKKLRFFKRV